MLVVENRKKQVAVDALVQVTQGRGHVVWSGAGVGQVCTANHSSWSTSLDLLVVENRK